MLLRTLCALALLIGVFGDRVSVVKLFGDVVGSLTHQYDLHDDVGMPMDCLHVQPVQDPSVWDGDIYFGTYHSYVGTEFQVRLASSSDLMHWRYHRTLLGNADMPYTARPRNSTDADDAWIVLTHEQWMTAGSQLPSQLGFKLYLNESELKAGRQASSFVAALSVGASSRLEGTPSLYSLEKRFHQGTWVVDADVGFHFNNENGVDQVASGRLLSFGPDDTGAAASLTDQIRADVYDDLFISYGAIGNIGQRQNGMVQGTRVVAQEANVGFMPPTVWEDWRVWLYFYALGEGHTPTGESGRIAMIPVITHGGSRAVGNPSFSVLPCPPGSGGEGSCLFVSYFLFSEGAAQGEAGVCVFVQQM